VKLRNRNRAIAISLGLHAVFVGLALQLGYFGFGPSHEERNVAVNFSLDEIDAVDVSLYRVKGSGSETVAENDPIKTNSAPSRPRLPVAEDRASDGSKPSVNELARFRPPVAAPEIVVSTLASVRARITVDVVGRVEKVDFLSSAYDASFKRAARTALRRHRFGHRDAGSFEVELVFKFEGPAKSAPRPDIAAVFKVAPPYPDSAAAECIEGKVATELTVGSNGQVDEVRILAAKPGGYFEGATETALRQWRYPSHMKSAKLRVDVVFMMSDEERLSCAKRTKPSIKRRYENELVTPASVSAMARVDFGLESR
jgi:TonB family protein